MRLAIDDADPAGEITTAVIVVMSSALRDRHGSAHLDSNMAHADDLYA